jgi:hypothetical protein
VAVSAPHVLLIIPRGEAVRNFVYSTMLRDLHTSGARVTLLSVVHDQRLREDVAGKVDAVFPLQDESQAAAARYIRSLIEAGHFRYIWSEVAKNVWETRRARDRDLRSHAATTVNHAAARAVANDRTLRALTTLYGRVRSRERPIRNHFELLRYLRPDVVFNGSHIHGSASDPPMFAARRLGIPSIGFVFSWDNLTSRSRIVVPYQHYAVWTTSIREDLLRIYPTVDPTRVHVTGTPQFDFHFDPANIMRRGDLASVLGISSDRPFVFYTTGIDRHFREEHRTVQLVHRELAAMPAERRPLLVVRTYVKGTSPEMAALKRVGLPDTVFPDVDWDPVLFTPSLADLRVYTSMVHHAAVGINAASTVSLELMLHDRPVINLGFDPPGSRLSHHDRWRRHIEFDHFAPVAASGGVAVADRPEDIGPLLREALEHPDKRSPERKAFIGSMFDGVLDGHSASRVAELIVRVAARSRCILDKRARSRWEP